MQVWWAAMVMGVVAGSVPWYTMMILHKRSSVLRNVDDTLGVAGLFAEPTLCDLFLPVTNSRGAFYGDGALFVVGWNVAVTSVICVAVNAVVPLRMSEGELEVGEEAYALWGDGELYDVTKHGARAAAVN
jgi:ammonium transporter, Amt family